jgi:HAD superfamily hydrolase (TIGR01548 family)
MTRDILVFDMDGVLVEVGESYRETICQTVEHFTGIKPTRERVQEYKNEGGWNNDWALSRKMAADLGVDLEYGEVIRYFNSLFYGNVVDGIPDGLMARERWIPRDGLLRQLAARYQLAIFTGREEEEARMTLRRFASGVQFAPLVAADHGITPKPAPDGLQLIARNHPGAELWYVGDTVDDARSSKAAGVPFVGVAAPDVPQRDRLLALFEEESAVFVVEDINQLPEVLLS